LYGIPDMIDSSIIITIVPPIITAIFAYLIARKKNVIAEKINKSKVDAEIHNQAFTIVRGVMNDMREELRREISDLRKDNDKLKEKVEENYSKIESLIEQCMISDKLVETLRSEIATLRATIKTYEDEIVRLKK
jgi:chromosome segregation ATPase